MKRIIFTLLSSFISVNLYAAAPTPTPGVEWSVNTPKEQVTVTNLTSAPMSILVHVNHYAPDWGDVLGYLSDVTTVKCAGTATTVKPDSSTICGVAAGDSIRISVLVSDFVHGSKGTYTILQ